MRLNKSTYPAYHCLENNLYELLRIDAMFKDEILTDSEKFIDFLNAIKFTYKQADKRYFVTEPFKEAIHTAAPKIIKDEKLFTDIPTGCGILFTNNGFTLYISNPTDKKLKLLCYGFTRDTLTTYGIIDKDFKYSGCAFSQKDGKPINDSKFCVDYLNGILLAIWFINNCEVDSKIVAPKQKYRDGGVKYFNESNSNFTVLNCNWFTDLIRNTPFTVKGHFRWQVHGEKHSKRKLIWVNEFEKSGYHRKATKDILQNEN
jgi:hypothetical protein